MYCKNCGKEVPDDSNFCPYCSIALNSSKQLPSDIKKNVSVEEAKRGCLILFAAIIFFVLFIYAFHNDNAPNVSKNNKPITNMTQTATGVSAEHAATINKILSDCGITDIKSMVHDADALDNNYDSGEKGYRIQNGDTKNIILYVAPDESVYRIRYADNDLYVNGETKFTLDKFVLTPEEKEKYIAYTQNMVKKILKASSTADFPWEYDEYQVIKTPDNVTVSGYVDAQNSFGAMLRSQYKVIYNKDTTHVNSFIFDGKKII